MLTQPLELAPLLLRQWPGEMALFNQITGQTHIFDSQIAPLFDWMSARDAFSHADVLQQANGLGLEEQLLAEWIEQLRQLQILLPGTASPRLGANE